VRGWFVAIAGVVAIALGGGCHREAPRVDAGRRVEPVGPFLRCLTASDVEVGGIANGQQVRRLVESAYEREGEAFVERVESACVPMVAGTELERVARQYVEKMRGWRGEDGDEDEDEDEDEDGIVGNARAWSGGYERFLGCVVPDLERVKDGQALYERLANACFKGDLAAFVARVRGDCEPLLMRKAPPKAAARWRRLRDPEGRHVGLWKQCLELAEEQRRLRDGEAMVAAVDAFLAARQRD
jgi:hypothetical protein